MFGFQLWLIKCMQGHTDGRLHCNLAPGMIKRMITVTVIVLEGTCSHYCSVSVFCFNEGLLYGSVPGKEDTGRKQEP